MTAHALFGLDLDPVPVCSHSRAGGPIPGRYDQIDLTPSKAMQTAAARGLRLRSEHGRGGTAKGLRMARRIVDGQRIHPDNVRDMFAFFSRFADLAREQRGTDAWNPRSPDVSALRIAWDLWGGDAGRAWARARRRQLEAADEAKAIGRTLWSFRGMVTRQAPRTEADRARVWRSWLESVQRPTERSITREWRTPRGGIFWDQARRYSERAARVLGGRRSVRRNVSADELEAILMRDAEVAAVLRQFDERTIQRGLERAYAAAARRLGEELASPDLVDVRDLQIADMVVNVSKTTEARIARIIEAGTDAGASINDIQRAIQFDAGFSPARALRVGRTETARAVSEGTDAAYRSAQDDAGAVFRVQWLSSRDAAVRPSHQPGGGLDGQTIDVGGMFVAPSGVRGRGPGLFGRDSGATKTTAAEDVNCFHPDTRVRGDFVAAVRSNYSGPMVEIRPASGAILCVTPGHPVLTPSGFRAAGSLRPGDHLLSYARVGDLHPVGEDSRHRPPSAAQVFRALEVAHTLRSVRLGVDDLHGDAEFIEGNVDVVVQNGALLGDHEPKPAERIGRRGLVSEHVRAALRASDGALSLHLTAVDLTTAGSMSSGDLTGDGVGATLADGLPLESLGSATTPDLDALLAELAAKRCATDAHFLAELQHRGAGLVSLDEVIEVRDVDYSGHVYDLQSRTGVLVSDTVITSNCRCTTIPTDIGG